MIQLDLTKEETEILADLLGRDLADLSYEIANTDSFDFRAGLKVRREVIHKVLERVKAA